MMRELKDTLKANIINRALSCSPNPYDEGTEREAKKKIVPAGHESCSPNPYDEGTERQSIFLSLHDKGVAAAQIPMMRELKVSNPSGNSNRQTALQPKSL